MGTSRLLCFFEDERAADFYPLSLSHATAELRCGVLPLFEKWSRRLPNDGLRFLVRPHLAGVATHRFGQPVNELAASEDSQVVFINPRFLPDTKLTAAVSAARDNQAFVAAGQLIALVLSADAAAFKRLAADVTAARTDASYQDRVSSLASLAKQKTEIEAQPVSYLWDLVARNATEILSDFELLQPGLDSKHMFDRAEIDDDVLIYGLDRVHVGAGSRIDGQVVLDARGGPILIGSNVRIAPHTRVEGPAFIGDDCHLVGGRIREGCSLGPVCRIGGEVEESIFHGYGNKYHDGFIGHAYVGEWVNLGAMTSNSDLKNNYGNIKVQMPSGVVETGLNKVGSFIGDHSKTGIGTLLTTGMVIGFSVNLFGGGLAGGRHVPSFAWGGADGFAVYDVEKAIATAKAVTSRRDSIFEQCYADLFRQIFTISDSLRSSFLSDQS